MVRDCPGSVAFQPHHRVIPHIVNDPNRADDPQYILRLLGKVISVSLETVEIVEGLPELGIEKAEPVVDASGDS